MGTQPRQRGHLGHSASQLPGQRPRGLRGGSEEVHRVLHVGAVLHHSRRRPSQCAPADTHTRGQYVSTTEGSVDSFVRQAVCSSLVCCCFFPAPGAVGHLSFTDILDTSLKVSWKEPQEKNGILTGSDFNVGD